MQRFLGDIRLRQLHNYMGVKIFTRYDDSVGHENIMYVAIGNLIIFLIEAKTYFAEYNDNSDYPYLRVAMFIKPITTKRPKGFWDFKGSRTNRLRRI